jgi:hypothetical protein
VPDPATENRPPELLLGPILRHVGEDDATVWIQTDRPCEVSINGCAQRTFTVADHFFALVEVTGLTPGEATPYTVELDGRRVWPETDYGLPPCSIRPHLAGEELELIFGSCRVSLPHEPPYVLPAAEHDEAQGIDALRTLAQGLADSGARLPDGLLMLGDQVYADDLSPALRELTRDREPGNDAPADELCDFDEYALAYREAWSEPLIRWLLSTVPTSMIFDDHEVHAQWKLSEPWQRKLRSRRDYERHISGGLMAYWIFQHLGNLSPGELAENGLYRAVREQGTGGADAGSMLRRQMADADRQAGHSRWSYCRDLGNSRLVVIDSRAGRSLKPGDRRMIEEDEWRWVVDRAAGDYEHLLLASSVPFFLTAGLHFAETWNAAITERGKRRLTRWVGEKIRQAMVMDHWASFPESFEQLCALLGEVVSGRCGDGDAPRSVVMLSGDVHHCYLAEVELADEPEASVPIWQAVCSAYRKDLSPKEKRVMRFGNSRTGERLARWLARRVGVEHSPARWQIVHDPSYENQVGRLRLGPDRAEVRVETTAGADWRAPKLRPVFEHDLLADRGRELSSAGT